MGQAVKEFGKSLDRFFLGHVLDHHREIIVVAPRARIDKIGLIHGCNNVTKHLIARNMTVNFVYYPEFLDVEMNERVILYSAVHRHLKEGHQVIPVIVIGYVIDKCFCIERFLIKTFKIILYDADGPVLIDLHLIEYPYLLSALENADHLRFFLDRQVAASPVGIIVLTYLPE